MPKRKLQIYSSSESVDDSSAHVCKHLPAYVTAAVLGRHPDELYPSVAAHLATCSTCRIERDELQALTADAYGEDVGAPDVFAEPDLSFLRARTREHPLSPYPAHRNDPAPIVLHLSPAVLTQRHPAAVVGGLRGDMLGTYDMVPDNRPDIRIRIEVAGETSESARIHIAVRFADRDPLAEPIPQMSVHMRAGNQEWHTTSDELGSAMFGAVPRDLLVPVHITIMPPEDVHGKPSSG